MVQYFIDGGAFMWPILISLIFGLGFSFERAYSLVISSINSKKFYDDIANILENESVQAAVDLCDKTPGPLAGVFHAGLTRFHRGLREVEKAIQNAGWAHRQVDTWNGGEFSKIFRFIAPPIWKTCSRIISEN